MRRAARSALVLLLACLATACGESGDPAPDVQKAPPQLALLGWEESYGKPGSRLVFGVSSFRVTDAGWAAKVEIRNDSPVSYSLGGQRASISRAFGVMLFRTGDRRDLEQRNRANELPELRSAVRFQPQLPDLLDRGASWRGTMSAPGNLVAGLWVRIVFGPLVAVGEPPEGLQDPVVWITDHAHELS